MEKVEMFLQNKLINYVLQPLASLTNRVPIKIREYIFVCAGSMIFLWNILKNAEIIQLRYLMTYSFGSLMIGIMLLCTLSPNIEPIRTDKRLIIPWYGFGLFMLISGLTNSVDYLADTTFILVAFPVVYLVWNNGNMRRIMQLFSEICRLVLAGLVIISVLFFPIVGKSYTSCFTNENGFSMFLAAVFCILLISVLDSEPNQAVFWVDLILIGFAYAFVYCSNSRTGQLAIQIPMVLTFAIIILQEKKQFWKRSFKKVSLIILALMVLYNGAIYVSYAVYSLRTSVSAAVGIENKEAGKNYDENMTMLSLTAIEGESGRLHSLSAAKKAGQPSVDEIIDSISQQHDNKTHLNSDLDRYSSGRISIWKGYLKNIDFWGHAVGETFIYNLEGKPAVSRTAHMTILEMAYRFGALAGLLFLAFNLIAGVKSVYYGWKRPEDRWTLAPFAVSVSFGIISLLSSVMSPYNYMIALCYYIVQTPLFLKADARLEK